VRKHPKDLLPFLWDAVPIEVRDAVPSEARDASLSLDMTKEGSLGRTKRRVARQDKKRTLGRTDGVERDCNSKVAQLDSRKCLSATQNRDERSNHTTFQTLSLRSVIKYTKALLLRGFSEK